MNATWTAQKATWFYNSLMESIRHMLTDARRFYGPAFNALIAMTNNAMPALPAKGIMTPNNELERVAPQVTLLQGVAKKPVDVSTVAKQIHFGGPITMDAEAFGVLVTRREGAQAGNLLTHEHSRLLDVLVSAKEWLGQCDEEERQFNIWTISSDARDARARNVWLEMGKVDQSHHITLTDM